MFSRSLQKPHNKGGFGGPGDINTPRCPVEEEKSDGGRRRFKGVSGEARVQVSRRLWHRLPGTDPLWGGRGWMPAHEIGGKQERESGLVGVGPSVVSCEPVIALDA